jgi:trimethylamine--corrinoid protein Co-methyltransferase
MSREDVSTSIPSQLRFLSSGEQERLHQAALWLLANVGMQFPSQEAVDLLRKAGAKIESKNIARIPREMVDHAVETAPKRDGFVLCGRDKKYDIRFGTDTPVLCSMKSATHVIDLETGERRPCTNRDVAEMVRLMDALDNVSINAPTATPQDVQHDTADWYAFASTLKNTTKPIFGPGTGAECVKDVVKMASLSVGGEDNFSERPFICFSILTRPPFQIDRLSLEAFIELSRRHLPVVLSSGPIMGMTSPVTIAGTVAQVHAEILACLVLSQLVRPGAPVIYTSFARSMDMKTVNVAMSSPEFAILKGALGQMGRYLGLPVCMPAFLRDGKVLDAQAGFETGTVGLVSALASDIIIGLQYDMDTLVDFADLVFSDEAMGALKRIARGFSVDEDKLGLDVITEVGHGGSFLNSKHTLTHFKGELWMPSLMERRSWAQWEKDGKKTTEQRARERAKEILARHQPERLAPGVEAEIDRIVQHATVDYSGEI